MNGAKASTIQGTYLGKPILVVLLAARPKQESSDERGVHRANKAEKCHEEERCRRVGEAFAQSLRWLRRQAGQHDSPGEKAVAQRIKDALYINNVRTKYSNYAEYRPNTSKEPSAEGCCIESDMKRTLSDQGEASEQKCRADKVPRECIFLDHSHANNKRHLDVTYATHEQPPRERRHGRQ